MSELLEGCEYRRPCEEVVARLTAADLAQQLALEQAGLEGITELGVAARRLREVAARFAELHHYGVPEARP